MECCTFDPARPVSLCSWKSKKLHTTNTWRSPYIVATWNSRRGFKGLAHGYQSSSEFSLRFWCHRAFSLPVNLKEEILSSQPESCSSDDEDSKNLSEELLSQPPPESSELKSLLADSERAKLITKLSEANQQNRFLKRQLLVKEDALVDFKNELVTAELEIQALVKLAEEIANSCIPKGSRKINGKYIQSHLLSRLEAVSNKLKYQIKDVDVAQSKEVPLIWYGMAENVQVMGTFDGWNQVEYLSPEYTGSYTMFSTTLLLRRGRYQIKFLVDGEWKLSPEFPTVGEGAMENNLLIVE